MCGNGTCSSCREIARDNSRSSRWRRGAKERKEEVADSGTELRTNFLDLPFVAFLVQKQQEGGKKGKEEE